MSHCLQNIMIISGFYITFLQMQMFVKCSRTKWNGNQKLSQLIAKVPYMLMVKKPEYIPNSSSNSKTRVVISGLGKYWKILEISMKGRIWGRISLIIYNIPWRLLMLSGPVIFSREIDLHRTEICYNSGTSLGSTWRLATLQSTLYWMGKEQAKVSMP